MHRIARIKNMKGSEWLTRVKDAGAAGLIDINPPEPGESSDWGIQGIGMDLDRAFNEVSHGITEKFNDFRNRGTETRKRGDTDGELAAQLHELLNGISKRQASDAGFWVYLSAFGCPAYTVWRWPNKAGDRMSASIRRNSLARLWWWAQSTHDDQYDIGDNRRYEATLHTRNRQDLVLWLGDCAISGNERISRILCQIQKEKELGGSDQQKLVKTMNRMLKMVSVDSLTDDSDIMEACLRAHSLSGKI